MLAQIDTVHVLTPSFHPAGGVVKIFDYVTYLLRLGVQVSVDCPEPFDADLPLFRIDRFRPLADGHRLLEFHSHDRISFGPRDLAFVSWPDHLDTVARRLAPGQSPERIIHIVQGVRHRDPAWKDGHPFRLLSRPAARIMTNHVVAEEVGPWVCPTSYSVVIPLGHDLGYFHEERSGPLGDPLRVAYTTWKSRVGDRVADIAPAGGYEFRAVREEVSWAELRELYHWADVFLATPFAEEGFYMPGLEAMEAGAIVITPDAVGNRAYCRFDENCLLVDHEDADSYLAALQRLRAMSAQDVQGLRQRAWASCRPHDLAVEEEAFAAFVHALVPRVERWEQQRQKV